MRIATAILALLLLAGFAPAQTCSFGLYADAAGTESFYAPTPYQPFDIYAVIHVEDVVAGVAYTTTFPEFLIVSESSYGPSGGGINVPSGGGNNVGLGECAIGFNNQPVLVTTYWALSTSLGPFGVATVGPNTDEDPLYPVYASCADQLVPCETTTVLYFEALDVDSASFGAVKSLYGN